ncbi:hypothetical protein LQG66_36845 [Bradyrhizobium ontarionense]|uniref:DUF4145 domain-containing protein n=1 Tax=Bradyrhizobium ontarionense TaxID=2898149 RepID=A0ABY3RBE3_9BRAD|nr:hypothetical protein [Bradyrhizobium sp. A19]UFZ04685.1 hypothetical protein LQG66_36845 [Bradyrhizobium sp. A19]
MNWLQFIADIVGHLAWPVVVLIIVFAVRKHLGSLAERILELSFGGATVKFDKLLSTGAELIEQAKEEEPEETAEEMTKTLSKHIDRLKDLRSQPADEGQAMVLFKDIELKLINIGIALGLAPQKGRLHARDVVRHLRSQKQIDSGFAKLFDTLQEGRNVLAHARRLSQSEIEEYVRQASFFLIQLEMWEERLNKKSGRSVPSG